MGEQLPYITVSYKETYSSSHLSCRFGREFRLPLETQLEDYSMFYIGGESLCLTNLMMFYNKCQVCWRL